MGWAADRGACSRCRRCISLAALVGSLIPVNRGWIEPDQGTTIYLADNGVHVDIIMPVEAQGLDWRAADPGARLRARRSGRRLHRVRGGRASMSISTRRPGGTSRRGTIWSALAGGDRVMHVEYVPSPYYAVRQIRLRPAGISPAVGGDPRRLHARRHGRPERIDHPGYGPSDAFYQATGKASALRTCNSWAAGKLRLAGVKTSLWPPFAQGLVWRYRRYNGLGLLKAAARNPVKAGRRT